MGLGAMLKAWGIGIGRGAPGRGLEPPRVPQSADRGGWSYRRFRLGGDAVPSNGETSGLAHLKRLSTDENSGADGQGGTFLGI